MRWAWSKTVNFGDWVGPYLYVQRTGRLPVFCNTLENGSHPVNFTVGSILHKVQHDNQAIVWGSGVMQRDARFARPRDIRAVRGPLTRARCLELGYDCPDVFGDPAILLPDHIAMSAPATGKVGLIPHLDHHAEAERLFGQRDDVTLIDVRRSVPEVVADIQSCAFLLSSSLHGLIVSHAFDRPCCFVAFSKPLVGDGTKFDDYYLSGGITDKVQARRLSGEESHETLVQAATEAAMPDLASLRDGLRESCPF
ncbi:polysaccharide pyruvyl transferase family protein [Roseivivax sp. THAF40]|nr:polysaccharide pyruvyl transferase family protein [Roseivivax sp. THAF40]